MRITKKVAYLGIAALLTAGCISKDISAVIQQVKQGEIKDHVSEGPLYSREGTAIYEGDTVDAKVTFNDHPPIGEFGSGDMLKLVLKDPETGETLCEIEDHGLDGLEYSHIDSFECANGKTFANGAYAGAVYDVALRSLEFNNQNSR